MGLLESRRIGTVEADAARDLHRERRPHRDRYLHRDVAADLVYVQNQTSRHFNYPDGVDAADRIYLRCLRRLLEGKCIVMPEMRELTRTLSGGAWMSWTRSSRCSRTASLVV